MIKDILAKFLSIPIRIYNGFHIKEYYRHHDFTALKDLSHNSFGKTLVIAPHVDDETIGCSSILLSVPCDLLYITDSAGSVGATKDTGRIRKQEAFDVQTHTRIQQLFFLDGPNNALEKDEKRLIEELTSFVGDYHSIFTVSYIDNHPEHFLSSKILARALELTRGTADIYLYEVSNLHNPQSLTHYYSLSREMMKKKAHLFKLFKSQKQMDFRIFLKLNEEKGRVLEQPGAEFFQKMSAESFCQSMKSAHLQKIQSQNPHRISHHRSFYKVIRDLKKRAY